MDSYDLKAILGEKLRRLTDKTLKALVDCMCTVGASLCSLDKRVSALESVEIPEGGYKPMQEPVASPSASGTAIQFIESASQDAAGRMTMTKKTVRTGSTSQTGVVQLEDSHSSTSTTKAATPNSVKEAYDLANTANSELANKQDKPSSATENNIATFNGTKSTKDSGKAFLPSTSTWDGTSDDKVPTAKAVQALLDDKWIGIARTATTTVNNAVYWPLFSFTRWNDYFSLQLEVDVTNGAFDTNVYETKIIDLGGYTQGGVEWANEIRICHKRVYSTRGYGNVIYYTMSNNVVTVYIKSACKANETQFCRLNKVVNQNSITNLTWYSADNPPEQPSSPTKFTEVLGGMRVDVSSYTTYASILAVFNAGGLPYYRYTSGNTTIDLTFAGTRAIPNVGMTLEFNAVQDNTIYYVGFVGSSSSFGTVRTFPLFSSDNVKTSSDTSSWSSDNTNVPTRAAVESKISSAMSGNIGGFLGSWTPIGVQYYQTFNDFKKGDWVSITEAGSVAYYKNNDRSQSYTTFAVNAGDDIYWTTSGEFQKKASTSLQTYAITNLSDWNDLENTGLYQIASQASNVQNSPSTGNCVCYVCEVNGAVVQFVISPNHLYKRYRGGSGSGQWGSWMAVDNIEIIVGTTSFNDLKALYGMTKNLVAVSSETVSSNNYTTLFALVSVKLSGSTPTEFIFERSCPHSAGQVGQVEQKICTSSGWSSALLNVKYSETSGTATNYNENVGSIKTALDGKIGRTPVGISSGSGVTNGAFFGAVLLIVLPSISDYPYNLGGNGMYISLKSFIEWAVGNTYKMQKGQIYMILNNRGGTVRLYKGTSTDSEYVSLDNDRIAFLGCWGLAVGTEYFLQKG